MPQYRETNLKPHTLVTITKLHLLVENSVNYQRNLRFEITSQFFFSTVYSLFHLTLYQARFFELLESRVFFFDSHQKNWYKSCLLQPNHLKLGTTGLWTLTKNFNISHVIKMVTSALFLIMSSFNKKFFLSYFQFFLCLNSTAFFFFFFEK